jgi:hypothetical protein
MPIVREDTPESARYFEIVSNPQDLSTILCRISAQRYVLVSDWLCDVEQVWANYEAVHPDPVHIGVVQECRRIFESILRASGLYPVADWCQDIHELHARLMRKLQTVPARYRQVLFPKHGRSAPGRREPTQDDLLELAQGLRGLSREDKVNAALILAGHGELPGDGATSQWVELGNLKTDTIRELQVLMATLADRATVGPNEEEPLPQ